MAEVLWRNSPGYFVTLEGAEGVGKSTAIRVLAEDLSEYGCDVLLVREPGGTEISEQVRDVLHALRNKAMRYGTEALLYSAARCQLVGEKIRPHLQRGGVVLSDRYMDSTLAYQGYGRGLSLEKLEVVQDLATEGLTPDLTVLFDLAPEVGLERKRRSGVEWNRMDDLSLDFYERARRGYLDLMRRDPARWVKVDASWGIEGVVDEVVRTVFARMRAVGILGWLTQDDMDRIRAEGEGWPVWE